MSVNFRTLPTFDSPSGAHGANPFSSTRLSRAAVLGALGLSLAAGLGVPIRAADEPVDLVSLEQIRKIGLDEKQSQVMDLAGWLTDVHGPRLTGSPNIEQAAKWAASKMREWKLDTAELEPWPADQPAGPTAAGAGTPAGANNGFPYGWVNDRFYMAAVSPQAFPIAGTPTAWTAGTSKTVRGEAILVTGTTREALLPFAGRLKGKWILSIAAPEVPALFSAPARRFTDEDLDRMAARGRATPTGRAGAAGARQGAPANPAAGRGAAAPAAPAPPFSRNDFLKAEGALGILTTTPRGHGVYTVGGAARAASPGATLPIVSIAAESYGRIARLLARGLPVIIEADIRNRFIPRPPMFNVIGEIKGSGRPDEVVMLGAHFDSWHASTGATDNAAGSAAVLEAMRLLKTSGVPLKRTVRAALWTGEEQGLIGSNLYVRQHFGGARVSRGQPPTPVTPAHATLAGYFNLDNGTGAIRGVYLQQNALVEPIFRAWMEPLRDLGMTHLTLSNTGGTDHTSFDAAGLPGWEFIQDEIEYNVMTHHTNLDSYERLQARDMRKNATILAAFAFLAANREELLPRKPTP